MNSLLIFLFVFLFFSISLLILSLYNILKIVKEIRFSTKIENQQKLLNFYTEQMLQNTCCKNHKVKCSKNCLHFKPGYLNADEKNLVFYINYPKCDLIRKKE